MPRWLTDDRMFVYMGTEKTKAMQMPPHRECALIAQWFEYENDDEYEKYDALFQNPYLAWLMLGACISNPAVGETPHQNIVGYFSQFESITFQNEQPG